MKVIYTSSKPANVRLRVKFIFEEKCNEFLEMEASEDSWVWGPRSLSL